MSNPIETTIIPKRTQVFSDTYANLPTTGLTAGDLGYATDRKTLYRWSGSAWESLTVYSASGTTAARPTAANLPEGSLYYNTTLGRIQQVQTGSWVDITVLPTTLGIAASDTARITNNTEKSCADVNFHKIKEIKFNQAFAATVRVYFEAKTSDGGRYYDALIYKNGVAIGTNRNGNNTGYVGYSEDLALNMAINDLLQLYMRQTGFGATVYGQNFQIRYSSVISQIGTDVLTTPLGTTTAPTIPSTTNQDP